MTYVFPPSLYPLRDYLKSKGFDGNAVKTSRQAAFVAQQLLGTRITFPSQGSDMTSTLLSIQKNIGESEKAGRGKAPTPACARSAAKRSGRARHTPKCSKINSVPEISSGCHIFCDGAAVPNPGLGGWGVAIYNNGVEVGQILGGDIDTTNNKMELTALLNAIAKAEEAVGNRPTLPITIWCDSQYCVNGVNDWRHKWKKHGWKKSPNSPEQVKNVDLWKAIDEAVSPFKEGMLKIKWVKGHAGIVGNERADELAEQGRASVNPANLPLSTAYDLDAQYRVIMAG